MKMVNDVFGSVMCFWRMVSSQLLILFLFGFVSNLFSFELHPDQHFKILDNSNITVLMDPNRSYSANDLPTALFTKANKGVLNFGFYDGAVWLKFEGKSTQKKNILLELENPMIDKADIFIFKDGKYHRIGQIGDQTVYSKRIINHRYHQIEVIVPNEFLIRVDNSGDQFFIPINVMDEQGLAARDKLGQLLWGFYFGLLFLIFWFVFAVYMLQREKSFVFYLGYIFSMLFFQFVLSGFAGQYLFGDSPALTNRLPTVLATFASLFLVLFIQEFLKTKENAIKLHKIFNASKFVLIGIFVLILCPDNGCLKIGAMAINMYALVMTLFLIPLTIISIRKGEKSAYLLLISFIIFIAGVALFVLRSLGVIPNNIISSFSLQFASAVEAIFISLAIVQKFKQDQDRASDLALQLNVLKQDETKRLEDEVNRRTTEIEVQKLEIEEINEQIISSIYYAQKIQESILPTEVDFLKNFGKGFVYYRPKDIVSGDFFWSSPVVDRSNNTMEYKVVFAVGDCTGHGVPGAMLSIVAMRIFNNSRFEKNINSAKTSLEYIDNEFKVLFQGEDGNRNFHEGMDLVVCVFNPRTLELEFAGAKNDLILLRDDKIEVFKGSKKTIGSVLFEEGFEQTLIQLQPGDRVYLTTDGFTDQFGGEGDKKLKSKRFMDFIQQIHGLSMSEQKREINRFFEEWKGNAEQTDDVCFIGLEF